MADLSPDMLVTFALAQRWMIENVTEIEDMDYYWEAWITNRDSEWSEHDVVELFEYTLENNDFAPLRIYKKLYNTNPPHTHLAIGALVAEGKSANDLRTIIRILGGPRVLTGSDLASVLATAVDSPIIEPETFKCVLELGLITRRDDLTHIRKSIEQAPPDNARNQCARYLREYIERGMHGPRVVNNKIDSRVMGLRKRK